ncbi:MAG TPA: hypothetical protein VGB88_06130 [Alphaproteobacteria bacterium]
MLLQVVHKPGTVPPTADEPGQELWAGGYQADRAEETDELTTSLAIASEGQLEIGTWYHLSDLKAYLAPAKQDDTWTEIMVPVDRPDNRHNTHTLTQQVFAINTIINAIVALFEKLTPNEDPWIRVE